MQEWLTVAEAAKHLKIKPRTASEWARQGRIPAHKLSGHQRCTWRFLRHELDAMLSASLASSADRRQQ